jgi:hypothetical protein
METEHMSYLMGLEKSASGTPWFDIDNRNFSYLNPLSYIWGAGKGIANVIHEPDNKAIDLQTQQSVNDTRNANDALEKEIQLRSNPSKLGIKPFKNIDIQKFINEHGVTSGAAGGGLLGAGIGSMVGNGGMGNALIGGALGAGGGALAGYLLRNNT